ncbi:MAG: hypothetical protein ACE5KU_05530 [Nitrososphaerales archaeon]
MSVSVKIEISESNYRKLLEAKEELDYDSVDEVLEDILDFWLSFVDLTRRRR